MLVENCVGLLIFKKRSRSTEPRARSRGHCTALLGRGTSRGRASCCCQPGALSPSQRHAHQAGFRVALVQGALLISRRPSNCTTSQFGLRDKQPLWRGRGLQAVPCFPYGEKIRLNLPFRAPVASSLNRAPCPLGCGGRSARFGIRAGQSECRASVSTPAIAFPAQCCAARRVVS